MKKLIMILSISVSLWSCSGSNNRDDDSGKRADEDNATAVDSLANDRDGGSAAGEDPASATMKEIMVTLLASKQQINLLQSEISDSLTKSGLAPERRSLFSKTIQQLETSSRLINKQIEQIVFTDLQSNKDKLNQIVSRMKASEKGLEGMVAKLDKITNYMQIASSLMSSLVPLTGVASHARER